MYIVGDIVVHASSGICEIEDIREEKFREQARIYYVIHPLNDNNSSKIYIPVDSEKCSIRKPLTKKEICLAIEKSLDAEIKWIEHNNSRKIAYSEILNSDDISRIIAMIQCLKERKEEMEALGRKLPIADEKILGDAKKRVNQEFSCILSIKENEVSAYIENHLIQFQ